MKSHPCEPSRRSGCSYLEAKSRRSLQRTSATYAIHGALAASERARDGPQRRGSQADIWRAGSGNDKLRRVAELERVKTDLQLGLAIHGEALEEREIVLDVPRTVKLITPGVPENRIQTRILRRAADWLREV